MRAFVMLFVHLIATVARLAGPGGIRSVIAESCSSNISGSSSIARGSVRSCLHRHSALFARVVVMSYSDLLSAADARFFLAQ